MANGFEIGVHGLKHDGKLFLAKKIFLSRARKINWYLDDWNSRGFTSPSMHHNLDWMHHLNMLYATSTFDTDPFEPQSDSLGTIFPMWVRNSRDAAGYIELPYTLAQDHGLFIILRERSIDIWKAKLDWIARQGGMALLNTHPDYMNFDHGRLLPEEYPVEHYRRLLEYLKEKYEERYWHATSRDVALFWRRTMINNPADPADPACPVGAKHRTGV